MPPPRFRKNSLVNSNMEIASPRGRIGRGWVAAAVAHAAAHSVNWAPFFWKVKRRPLAAASLHHANEMLWFFSGNERMRLPVAAKYALSTAGAATQIVGSPTPPQKPPDAMRIVSTFGISAMRIEL